MFRRPRGVFRSRFRLLSLESRIVPTAGYFRMVSYNLASSDNPGTPRPGLDTILQGIGSEVVAGQAAAIDLIALAEVNSQSTTTNSVQSLLNTLYGPGVYSRGTVNGSSTGSGTLGVVFNSQKLQLLSESKIGTAGTAPLQPRQSMRYQFHPIGYPASSDFYVYVSHWKSDTGSADEARRLVEAQAIRDDADALGQGVNILYMGDLNTYTSSDDGFQELLSAGNGQAFDPVNQLGSWSNNSKYAAIMSQAPSNSPPSGLVGGGLDDRFDFILQTGELTDGKALDYVTSTYHSFGNNGSVPINSSINDPSSTALPGLANRTTILNLLTTVTDHLPVVADFRILVPPKVQSVTINGGSPQRSMVSNLAVAFDSPVTFSGSPVNAFQLKRQSDSAVVTLNAAVSGNTVTLTFTGGAIDGASLADGRYTLIVNAANITATGTNEQLDGNGDGTGGDNFVFASAAVPLSPTNIFRLFGDSNADGKVDSTDFIAFRAAFNASGPAPPYDGAFDFNGDNKIDSTDFIAFRARFNLSVP